MAKSYSDHFKERVSSLSGEAPSYLLEITHPQLAQPIRICNDVQDIVSNGVTFTAMAFKISLPDDFEQKLPRAAISIDNVGRELTQWLDQSYGGRGAQVRVMQIMRDTPNVVEFDITCDLLSVKQSALEVTGEIGFEDLLGRPGLAILYRPDNTPTLF